MSEQNVPFIDPKTGHYWVTNVVLRIQPPMPFAATRETYVPFFQPSEAVKYAAFLRKECHEKDKENCNILVYLSAVPVARTAEEQRAEVDARFNAARARGEEIVPPIELPEVIQLAFNEDQKDAARYPANEMGSASGDDMISRVLGNILGDVAKHHNGG